MTEDGMIAWHHRLNQREFEQARTGKLGVLQSMGSQRVEHDWATEQQQQHCVSQGELSWMYDYK